jgi:alkylhydroperoxidase family enzyme
MEIAMTRTALPNPEHVPADETILARKDHTTDPKRDAAIQFARKVIQTRGQVSDSDLKAVRDAGYTDENVTEIVALVALVALYSVTNFFNDVFDTKRDSPEVTPAASI